MTASLCECGLENPAIQAGGHPAADRRHRLHRGPRHRTVLRRRVAAAQAVRLAARLRPARHRRHRPGQRSAGQRRIQSNNLTGEIQPTGLGTPNPSRLSIIRRTKDYGQLVIVVDLNKAFRDKRENILIQPGDVLILQQTPAEALHSTSRQTIRFNYLATLVNQAYLQVTSNANLF